MFQPFINGLSLGLSLILVIGAQNVFVLRQGLSKSHVFLTAIFCSLADTILIIIGVSGASIIMENNIAFLKSVLFTFAAIWLSFYGFLRVISAVKSNSFINDEEAKTSELFPTIVLAAGLTFINPHVYLDTVVLIGTVSLQYLTLNEKVSYAFGASLASFFFFFLLAYGARFLAPLMSRSFSWSILDSVIALFMFYLAYIMFRASGLI